MTSRRLLAALTAFAVYGSITGQLSWVSEPPARLVFSNATGARVSCTAAGTPPPHAAWLADDGAPLHDVPGLRQSFANGTLWLGPFEASQYRGDVHATVYRCRAASSAGVIVSRDMRVQAVMEVWWEVRLQATTASSGGSALLACSVPAPLRTLIAATRWFVDGQPLPAHPPDGANSRYITGGSRNDMLIVRELRVEESPTIVCEVTHALTGDTRRSAPHTLVVTQPASSMAPRIVAVSEDEVVDEGADIRLVCAAIGNPPPTYSWFRHINGRSIAVTSDVRVSAWGQVVAVRRAAAGDAGAWTCRAHNALGEQRRDAALRVRTPLRVHIEPQMQIANSGSSVSFNCSVRGGEARLRWLHDGAPAAAAAATAASGGPAGGAHSVLHVHNVARVHRGMYQCFAERDLDTAQAAAELRLGETAPELQYTFIEQALRPGPALTLHCAASGAPPPRFLWLRDMQPLQEHNTPQRSISEQITPNGEVVSYLNISSVRAEDGGRYTCRATNSRGTIEHSARLNVYGPPSIRNIGPIRVVAGVNTTIHCPYSGFPISEIRWQRGGMDVSSSGGRTLSGVGGELQLWPAEQADAGVYSCRVTAPNGQYAIKDIQIFVRNPPRIAGFSFPTDLVEGSSIQVLCGITSGDKPVYFSWLKDGLHIPSSLQVQEKSLEEFSFLIFSHVTSKHSGDYTCVASNSAAEVNHTARLAVKVAPSWVYEPQDVSALLGAQIMAHCSTRGYPEPRITWLKGHGTAVGNFRPVSNMDLQFLVLSNGSLSIAPAAHHHEGQYMCRAENGIGRGLSKIIAVSINEPAHFEYSSRNLTVKRTAQATLQCDARGDPPIQLQWTHNMKPVDLTTYRVSVSEKRLESGVSSQLSIAHAERQDSGVYRCRAENAYGRDELLIYLAVQEFPEAPRGLHISKKQARGAIIAWRRGYDGNARVRAYRLQYRVVGDRHRTERDDWTLAPTRDIPADRTFERLESETSTDIFLEYRVEGLRPATAYALRLAAINAIGDSEYSDSVIVQTLEEAPSEPPHNVQVQATAPGELLVKWQAPPQDSWNGELLGYVVTWKEVGASENSSAALTAAGWSATQATLVALRTHAHYEVLVRAFNAVGAGPPCTPLAATTLEGVPEASPDRVRCEPLSAQSIRVWWEPPPSTARGGVLLGYEVLYEVVNNLDSHVETRRSGGMETVLQSLQRAANYSITLRARTAAGAGPASPPIYCNTHEDIPGSPADIKALPNSEDSVVVSWLAPVQKNGKIKHYTVYNRPQRVGQQTQLVVVNKDDEEEHHVLVTGLQELHTYEFWVTATTASGEGEMSSVVAAKPNARAPAKVASFGRRLVSGAGRRVRVPCAVAGAPPPLRAWSRRRPASPIASDPRFAIEGFFLVILSADRSLSDNYTCLARNPWGSERATWELRVVSVPARAALRLAAASAAALHLVWQLHPDPDPNPDAHTALAPVHSYTLEYCRESDGQCRSSQLAGSARAHTLERLSCGAQYRVRLTAHNSLGAGPPSQDLVVSTKGGPSKPAPEKDLISTNNSCVRLNLLTWDSNGCPLLRFQVSMRSISESSWRTESVPALAQPLVLCNLTPATWYQLKVLATSAAGNTQGNYYFATLTDDGERIPAPATFPAEGGGAAPVAVVAAAAAPLCALLLLAALAWRRSLVSRSCLRKGLDQGGGAVSAAGGDSKCADTDNRRNLHQLYTTAPTKLRSCADSDHQEMYEISPYATFSMSEGATCAGVAGGGTLRTFGRAEPPPLSSGAPLPLLASASQHRALHSHKHRSPAHSDDYSVSRAMTLMVRRAESDSDSSGSPCTDCTAPSYRLPIPTGKEESVRGVTDSSAESTDARSLSQHGRHRAPPAPAVPPASTAAAAAGDGQPAGPADKARRRTRRHHTPTASRYQQRQEQERRDFTIHV